MMRCDTKHQKRDNRKYCILNYYQASSLFFAFSFSDHVATWLSPNVHTKVTDVFTLRSQVIIWARIGKSIISDRICNNLIYVISRTMGRYPGALDGKHTVQWRKCRKLLPAQLH